MPGVEVVLSSPDRPRPALRVMLGLAGLTARLGRVEAHRGLDSKTVEQRRADLAGGPLSMAVLTRPGRRPLLVDDHPVPVPGGQLNVRRYRPRDRVGPLPTHLFVHGGCYWLGDVDGYDPLCRWYASEVDAQVVSVGYRRAPEHPYPVPLEDSYAALIWLAEHARGLGVDLGRVSVGGVSAGGGLAAAVALLARDRSGPALCLQVLEIPMLDPSMSSASLATYADGYNLTRAEIAEGWAHYLPDPTRAAEPYADPLRADLAGLPPAFVLTAGCDPLRDEGEAYADRLVAAGVAVQRHRAPGHVHGSVYLTRLLPSARRTVDLTTAALARAYR